MSLNIASMQAGLALLGPQGMSRPSGQTVTDVASIESRAVRLAKAQFTAPASTPPWQASASGTDSSRLAAVRAMKSLIDKPSSTSALGVDIDASFAIWKALDRLQLLARAATRATLLASERSAMAEQFSKGMAALQAYMATVDSRQLNLSFGQPARRVDTLAIGKPALGSGARGRGVATDRSAAIPGLDPARTLRVGVTRGGTTQHFDLALASLAQPPSLDHLAEALNTGLQGLAATARFSVEKAASKWHLALSAPASEAIAIDEVDAPDALIVAASDGVPGGAGPARVVRYDAPEAQMSRHLLGMIAATDRQAMLASAKPDTVIPATLAIRASVTDARGFTTLLATTDGDVGDQRAEGNGHRDLVLTRLDSRGQAVWQRMLGAVGDTEAAAFALAENGDVVVAATVAGGRDGGLAGGDVLGASDMVVSRYDSQGDVQFATLV
ncbi:MAG: hypothetical protein RIS17_1499, partial [Pseudomonadota bacterium]